MAKYIKLYHNIFEGTETSYKCLRFDIENAVLNSDYQITSNRTYTNSATGNTVENITFSLLPSGFALLSDFETDRSKTLLPSNIQYVYDSDSEHYVQSNKNDFNEIEIGTKPVDFDGTANHYKYWGDLQTATINTKTYEFYENIYHATQNPVTWDASKQYYSCINQKYLYFTYGKMKFGVSNFAYRDGIYSTAFYAFHSFNNSFSDKSFMATSNGFSGNLLQLNSHTYGTLQTYIGVNVNVTFQMCYVVYNDKEYYGIACIERDISNIITSVKLIVLSKECWVKDTSRNVGYGADSEAEGGNGTYDDSTDTITITDPGGNIGSWYLGQNTGLAYYALNGSTFNQLCRKLYNSTFKDELNTIVSCILLPLHVGGTGHANIKLGTKDTGINANILAISETTELDFGSIALAEYFGTYNDYYGTNIEIYLPFCGSMKIPAHSCVGGSVHCYCTVNLTNGDMLYKVYTFDKYNVGNVFYQNGNCARQIPLTSNNNNELKQIMNVISGVASAISGNVAGLASSGLNMLTTAATAQNVSIKGGIGGGTGCYGCLYPYLIITRENVSTPEKYDSEKGRPSDIYTELSNVSGFAQISYCKLSLPNATKKEIEAIEKQLKEGVIF